MKNLIFTLACTTLLFSCTIEKETEILAVDFESISESRTIRADELVGSWEDSDRVTLNNTPKPVYEFNSDGTYNIRHQFSEDDMPTCGTWNLDAEKSTINFVPKNTDPATVKHNWVVTSFSTERLSVSFSDGTGCSGYGTGCSQMNLLRR
jgi:hypothetical protein